MRISFNGIRRLIRQDLADKQQAGAIVLRGEGEERRFLVVTNKDKDQWIFPKGSVKKKETPEEAAEREAEEESGAVGRVVAYVGATELNQNGKTVRVDYFLLQLESEHDEREDRKKKWCTADELLECLDPPELRALVKRALPEIAAFR